MLNFCYLRTLVLNVNLENDEDTVHTILLESLEKQK